MKKTLVHILNSVLLIIILVSTTGITIYTHYCSENNIKKTSLFESSIKCDHHHQEVQHECDTDNTTCDLHNKSKKCCHDYEQTFVLTLNIEIQHFTPDSKPVCILSPINIIALNSDMEHYNNKNKPEYNYCLPHPHTGKQIVLFYRNLKIPPLPVC